MPVNQTRHVIKMLNTIKCQTVILFSSESMEMKTLKKVYDKPTK